MMVCLLAERYLKYIQKGEKQKIKHAKIMKLVKTLTYVSLINEKFKFLLNSNKQDGGINKRGLFIKKTSKINLRSSMHIKFFKSSKLKFQKLLQMSEKKCCHLTVRCLLGRINSN